MNNYWYALVERSRTMAGDASFIEFTVDASGYEISSGTPKIDTYFTAPWAIPSGYPTNAAPKYISVWDVIYHPEIVARAKNG